jgi:hypothetical protein
MVKPGSKKNRGLAGVLVGLTLIDRVGRRRLLYIAVIAEACANLADD